MGSAAGTKRDYDGIARKRAHGDHAGAATASGENGKQNTGTDAAPRTPFTALFEGFRNELDEHHDRKERIIKVSRDVTALSKKIIFALQRVKELNAPIAASTTGQITTHMATIGNLLASVTPDLRGINRHRYGYQLRCVEELVEALTLRHYLADQTLLGPDSISSVLPEGLELTDHDYLYGIFDLFGEMMRFATVLAAREGALAGSRQPSGDQGSGRTILEDMHTLSSNIEMLPPVPGKMFGSKLETMRQSVAKVEKLGYGLAIRSNERSKGWMPDMDDV